jgi:hypothetical protein
VTDEMVNPLEIEAGATAEPLINYICSGPRVVTNSLCSVRKDDKQRLELFLTSRITSNDTEIFALIERLNLTTFASLNRPISSKQNRR